MITHQHGDKIDGQTRIDSRWVGGLALIAIGAVTLVGQFVDTNFAGTLVLPTFAVIFLAWGIATRKAGLMVPAGIFIGLSIGTWLVLTDWVTDNLSDEAIGGTFLLAFAVGWASITVLTRLFTNDMHWWPLIPAGVMALIGTALFLGDEGIQALVWLGYVWPLILVAAGVFLLLQRGRDRG